MYTIRLKNNEVIVGLPNYFQLEFQIPSTTENYQWVVYEISEVEQKIMAKIAAFGVLMIYVCKVGTTK